MASVCVVVWLQQFLHEFFFSSLRFRIYCLGGFSQRLAQIRRSLLPNFVSELSDRFAVALHSLLGGMRWVLYLIFFGLVGAASANFLLAQ
jgi:hypothetical protein